MRLLHRTAVVLFATIVFAPTPLAHADVAYQWPLRPRPPVVTPYDPPTHRWEPGHRGVDLGASAGVAVLAAASGTVWFAGKVADKPVVSIRHADGLLTTYEPVIASVRKGDVVVRGQIIGTLGTGHPDCQTSTCLHWGARRGAGSTAAYLNPLSLVGAVRVRLKPLS